MRPAILGARMASGAAWAGLAPTPHVAVVTAFVVINILGGLYFLVALGFLRGVERGETVIEALHKEIREEGNLTATSTPAARAASSVFLMLAIVPLAPAMSKPARST